MIRWRHCILMTIVFCFGINIHAQNNLFVLKDSAEVASQEGRFDDAVIWYDSLLLSAKSVNDREYLGIANESLSSIYYIRRSYSESLPYTRAAIKLLSKQKPLGALVANTRLSVILRETGKVDSSNYYLNKSIAWAPEVNDTTGYIEVYNAAGVQKYYQSELDSAAYYFDLQLQYTIPSDTMSVYSLYINLTKIYQRLGQLNVALDYANDAVNLLKGSAKFRSYYTRSLSSIAEVYSNRKEYNLSEDYAQQAVNISLQDGLTRGKNSRYTTLVDAQVRNGNLSAAFENFKRIDPPSEKTGLALQVQYYLTGFDLGIKGGYQDLAKRMFDNVTPLIEEQDGAGEEVRYRKLTTVYFEGQGMHERALAELKAFMNADRKDLNTKNANAVLELQAKYDDIEKKKIISEQELKISQAQSTQRLLLAGVGAVLLLGGLTFWFIRRQSRIKAELQKTEIQKLKNENKIIAIQSLLSGQEDERKRIAQDLHDNIGTLMSTIKMKVLDIQKSIESVQRINIVGEIDDMVGQASSEIRRISHNMTPVVMDLTGLEGAIEDFGTLLRDHGIAPSFDLKGLDRISSKEREVIIFRVLQELVNNIRKHSGARSASIKTNVVEDSLLLEVVDDGVGMTGEQWQEGKGMGTKSIKSRVDYLEGTIEMTSENGTTFKIQIPL